MGDPLGYVLLLFKEVGEGQLRDGKHTGDGRVGPSQKVKGILEVPVVIDHHVLEFL